MASLPDTVTVWRTVRPAYADSAFSGEGARLYGGRWNHVGTPVVYLSEHRSLAVLELLTQALNADDLAGLLLVSATIEARRIEALRPLPPGWNAHPAPASTADAGTEWVRSNRSLMLQVPSAVLPSESNYVLNPRHPEIARVSFSAPEPLQMDPRL